MIVTVEEAKTKWCPLVRFTDVPQAHITCNNRTGLSADVNCIADQCMAWTPAFVNAEDEQPGIERGYCGLAK